ncbi:sugar phosphate isomerase/epimerase family protein [Arundinibacter roseus]|uniref:Sugar phosphate isomerase/epimerase n=1 Tax=Arundinibacter roseus TaxID=2070510 RepID=A0A4R4K2Z6_9BACT|nr:sugar phosphate isomerase/epimerase [Arundinibacter roseus]TDB60856.1 sugar phosphate isomerase/epimerase [Arundinibacter roseus]
MSISRKEFIKTSALALTLPFLSNTFTSAKPPRKVGLQLYTLRELMAKDPKGTLKQVADIGFKEVETFGYANGTFFGMAPAEFKSFLKDLGMSTPSGHYMPDQLKSGWNKIVDDASAAGQKYMMCAYIMPNERTLEDYKKFITLFNEAGEVCKKAGIQFGYHNHDFEFETVDGQIPYDMILKGTDPALVKMELDLYWAAYANQDPVALFTQNPGRFPLVHMKDMAKTPKREFAEVGNGSIDFQRILNAAKVAGLKHLFVEQDVTVQPPLEAIAVSYSNIKKMNM